MNLDKPPFAGDAKRKASASGKTPPASAHANEIERLNRLYTALSHVNQAIVRMPTRDELFQSVCRILVEDGGFSMAWIGWHDPETRVLMPVADWGDQNGYLQSIRIYVDDRPEGRGPTGTAFREVRPCICNDMLSDPALPWREEVERRGFRASAAFPIRENDSVCATLTVYADETGFFQDKEITLLSEVAIDISFALDNLAREAGRKRAEEAATLALRRLTEAQRIGQIGDWEWDMATDAITWSPQVFEIFGRDPGLGPPRNYAETAAFFDAASQALQTERITRAIESGEPQDYELVARRTNGEQVDVLGRAMPRKDDSGRVLGLYGTVQDITARKRSEAALKESEAELNEAQRLAGLGSWYFDIASGSVRWSEATFAIFGRDPGLGAPPYNEHARILMPESLAKMEAAMSKTIEQNVPFEIELEAIRPDQTRRWMLARGEPVPDEAGSISAVRGTALDITDRKRAEAELEKTHQDLVEASRRAGMAEVATGILHNVGNVLNSVNVASGCVAESIRKSKAANLTKVVTLLREHEADLSAFLTSHPQGKQIPGYLAQLATHLVGEQAAALDELAHLQKNIAHIKDIVAMQQSLAKVSGITERLAVADLVEDALKINSSALIHHRIVAIREFQNVPLITVEKNKVLQILVNLVRNAQQACCESDLPEKRLTLRVAQGEDRIRITVTDNGIGIPAENLARIFTHGFTTKKSGHGFGLHSGALAAREMGGSLSVQSAGPGQGAAFTLELPVSQTENLGD